MLKNVVLSFAFLLTGLSLHAQNVEEIIEIHREVMGFENWAGVTTITLEGKSSFGNFEIPYTSYIYGAKMRNEITTGFFSMIQVYDGEAGYMKVNSSRGGGEEVMDLPPAANQALQSRIDFGLDLLKITDLEFLTLAGSEEMEGLTVFKLIFDSPVNPLTEFYVDSESYVLIQKKVIREWQGETTINITNYSDFKMVNGMLIAHARDTKIEGTAVENRRGGQGQGGFGGGPGGGGPGGGGMRGGGGGPGGGGMSGMAVGMLSRPGKDLITKLVFNEQVDVSLFTKESIGGK
jgi:uncharacterized membrane protein YgcG